MSELEDLYGPVIHSYTRDQAIGDGVLIEVPVEIAEEAGFKLPVALTALAWDTRVGC